ncbi:hypothetical protein O181_083853 [Austropuccinia psidii MF-1]|uniref:Uncharacterized protein n=1 Tax=Austropuccinia psidii MF-1 TaxID=1389203 RepID=A0A9Q3FUG5_9BASI|nr:hypothetical protein [Austropuccinia psidii MF-1]
MRRKEGVPMGYVPYKVLSYLALPPQNPAQLSLWVHDSASSSPCLLRCPSPLLVHSTLLLFGFQQAWSPTRSQCFIRNPYHSNASLQATSTGMSVCSAHAFRLC